MSPILRRPGTDAGDGHTADGRQPARPPLRRAGVAVRGRIRRHRDQRHDRGHRLPGVRSGTTSVDLGMATVSHTCETAQVLIDPDSLWECTCVCDPNNEFSLIPVTGCATATATTASAACAQICPRKVCGGALACGFGGTCAATSTGTLLSTDSCAVADGPPAGAAPASTADFRASAGNASTAVLHVGGQTSTTAMTGAAFFNVASSPPGPMRASRSAPRRDPGRRVRGGGGQRHGHQHQARSPGARSGRSHQREPVPHRRRRGRVHPHHADPAQRR